MPPADNPTTDQPDLSFEDIDPRYRAFLTDYLRLYGLDPEPFCRPLPGADEMFFKAILPNYEFDPGIAAFKFTESTLRLLDAYRQIVDQAFGGFDRLGSVLDFASGYGRLTRALTQKLSPEQIWVADIYREAIDYQRATFGVNGVYSAKSPAGLQHDRTHDLVFVGSMFSHLPAELFHAWLARLYALVAPNGVLAFTVHDETFLPPGEEMDASGIRYFRFSESGSLDADIYGMSYVTEAFVGDAIARLPGAPSWRRFHKGVYENQDLYIVGGPGRDVSQIFVASTPMGGFETATHLTNGEVEFAGWTHERTPGRAIQRLVVHVDGQPRRVVTPAGERPDVLAHFPKAANMPLAWRFRLAAEPGQMIRVQMESDSGLLGCCYAEFPPQLAATYSGWSRRSLRQG
ncbi:MAG TPA: class I SAM-dependent methyltransferase [Phenylobacterium sp.]